MELLWGRLGGDIYYFISSREGGGVARVHAGVAHQLVHAKIKKKKNVQTGLCAIIM